MSFESNLESIKNNISDDLYHVLIKLSTIQDEDDNIKKLTIGFLLDDEYVKELDWLYSTLYDQQSVEEFKL